MKVININIKDYGTIKFQLTPELSPVNCEQFVKFVEAGLFNHRYIQRIAPNFVLQFTYENYQDPRLECITDLERCDIPFTKGTVALGGDGQYISSPADFFITLAPSKKLDFNYSIIGKVIEGMDIVDKIASVPCTNIPLSDAPGVVVNRPNTDIIVESIEVINHENKS